MYLKVAWQSTWEENGGGLWSRLSYCITLSSEHCLRNRRRSLVSRTKEVCGSLVSPICSSAYSGDWKLIARRWTELREKKQSICKKERISFGFFFLSPERSINLFLLHHPGKCCCSRTPLHHQTLSKIFRIRRCCCCCATTSLSTSAEESNNNNNTSSCITIASSSCSSQ